MEGLKELHGRKDGDTMTTVMHRKRSLKASFTDGAMFCIKLQLHPAGVTQLIGQHC